MNKSGYLACGIGLTLATQMIYGIITKPDLVYRHRHFNNEHGRLRVDARGAKFNGYIFVGGNESPKNVEQMLNEAVSDFKKFELLEQVGIYSNQPVREVRIEIRE